MDIFAIVHEAVKNGINVTMVNNTELLCTEYHVPGFSKSGMAVLRDTKDGVIAYTRYERQDVITDFDSLAMLAFEWYNNYRNREPFTNPYPAWAEIFVSKGWLTRKTETVVTYS